MFSKRIISLIVVLSLVAQTMVLTNTDNSSNFVEDSSPLEELIEFFPGRVKRDEWVKQASELAK